FQSPPLSAVAIPPFKVLSVILLSVRAYRVIVFFAVLRGLLFNVLNVLLLPLGFGRADLLGIVLSILPSGCLSLFLVLLVPLSILLPDSLGVFLGVLLPLGFQLSSVLFAVTSVVLKLLVFVT